jgi:hypothetical protein
MCCLAALRSQHMGKWVARNALQKRPAVVLDQVNPQALAGVVPAQGNPQGLAVAVEPCRGLARGP